MIIKRESRNNRHNVFLSNLYFFITSQRIETFLVDGGYSDFGDWSECSAECGGGTQTRSRTCTNPAPANGGADCEGDSTESRECNTQGCPGKSSEGLKSFELMTNVYAVTQDHKSGFLLENNENARLDPWPCGNKLSAETFISLRQQLTCPFICRTKLTTLQLTVDTVTSETGQSALLNVMEELRQEVELVQTLLLQTEELTV